MTWRRSKINQVLSSDTSLVMSSNVSRVIRSNASRVMRLSYIGFVGEDAYLRLFVLDGCSLQMGIAMGVAMTRDGLWRYAYDNVFTYELAACEGGRLGIY